MSKEKNQTNRNNGDKVAGTGLSTLTPRPYAKGTARHNSGGGTSGEDSTPGNRNKRS